jgi:hypothetical protein
MWKNQNPHSLLVGMKKGAAILENNLTIPQKIKHCWAPWHKPITATWETEIGRMVVQGPPR